jgi:hypothetical protein
VICIWFDPNLPQGEIDYKNTKYRIRNTEEKRLETGESYRVVETQAENETEERRLDTDLLPEFIQGASKSQMLKDLCVIVSVTS